MFDHKRDQGAKYTLTSSKML